MNGAFLKDVDGLPWKSQSEFCVVRATHKVKIFALSVVPHFSLSPLLLAFLAWGDFHAHSRFARSTIPEGK